RGRDITHLPAHERALLGIGYAPEDAGIFPDLTVEENFQITSWLARPDAARGAAAPAGDGYERVFSLFPEVREVLTRRGRPLTRTAAGLAHAPPAAPLALCRTRLASTGLARPATAPGAPASAPAGSLCPAARVPRPRAGVPRPGVHLLLAAGEMEPTPRQELP